MQTKTKYRGVVVPMVTPVTTDGEIDESSVAKLCDHLVDGGVEGVFPLGTTGEASSIQSQDRLRLVAATARCVAGRATVYAGISSNCFKESTEAARAYEQLGVDAVVAHMPSYYPLNDAEIEAYFVKLADALPLPLVLYNIPATTHHAIAIDTVDRLRHHPRIVAIKDSSSDRNRSTELLRRMGGRDGFPVLVGNSSLFLHGMQHGGVGVVPSGGNLVPEMYSAMMHAASSANWPKVEELCHQTDRICNDYLKGNSLGRSLAVLKAMLERRGLCGRSMFPPIQEYKGEVSAAYELDSVPAA